MTRTTLDTRIVREYIKSEYDQFLTGSYVTSLLSDLRYAYNNNSVRSDVIRVPDWRKRCREGASASTAPYTATIKGFRILRQAVGSPWITTSPTPGYRYTFQGCASNLLGVYQPALSVAAVNRIRLNSQNRFVQALRSKRAEFAGPTFLGELRETVGMIRRPAKSFLQGLDRYLRDVRKARRGLKPGLSLTRRVEKIEGLAGDIWLEASLGWQPAISDAKNIATLIARWRTERLSPIVRAQDNATETSSVYGDRNFTTAHVHSRLTSRGEVRGGSTFTGRLKAEAAIPQQGSARRLIQLSGFSWENFIPTIWELIPASFVVDYFLNVDDFISAATTDRAWLSWVQHVEWLDAKEYSTLELFPASTGLKFSKTGDGSWGAVLKTMGSFTRRTDVDPFDVELAWTQPGYPAQFLNLAALLLARARNFKP